MAKILLLNPPTKERMVRDINYGCWHSNKWIEYKWPPITLYYLKKSLIKDHKIVLLDYSITPVKDADDTIKNFNPEFIVFSADHKTIKEDFEFIRKLNIKAKVVLFGPLATLFPEKVLNNGADFVIRGDPEIVIRSIEKFGKKRLPSVASKDKEAQICRIRYLDSIPFPERCIKEAHKYKNPFAIDTPFTTMLISRGCNHRCIFCTSPLINGLKIRHRSVKNVIEEMKILQAQGFKEILFRDENLCFDKDYITELCKKMIDSNIKLSWICNSRVDSLDEEIIKIMKKAGCHTVKLGVESGSQKILDDIKKGIRLDEIQKVFSLCKKNDLRTIAHFIIGNVGDDIRSIKETIRFAKELDPTYASFDILEKIEGTAAYDKKDKISKEELKKYYMLAFRSFYIRPSYILKNIFKTKSLVELREKIKSSIGLWGALFKR